MILPIYSRHQNDGLGTFLYPCNFGHLMALLDHWGALIAHLGALQLVHLGTQLGDLRRILLNSIFVSPFMNSE